MKRSLIGRFLFLTVVLCSSAQATRFDAETGLNYYKNRYHSTALGRFISRDPIGYDLGNFFEELDSRRHYTAEARIEIPLAIARALNSKRRPAGIRPVPKIDAEINCNLYCYASSSPTAKVDPFGLKELDTGLGVFCRCDAPWKYPLKNECNEENIGAIVVTQSTGKCFGSALGWATGWCASCDEYKCTRTMHWRCSKGGAFGPQFRPGGGGILMGNDDHNCP